MEFRKVTYDDPTGGGDDITLEFPIWVNPPRTITVYSDEDDRYDFDLVD